MGGFVRSKFLLLLASLVMLIAVTPLAITTVHLYAAHAAAPPEVSKGHHSLQGHHGPLRRFDSTTLDWPEFHADAARDGNQSMNAVLSNANAGSLVPVSGSAFTTTGSAQDSPAIYQGILYYAASTLVVSGTQTLHVSTMYAVDVTTGLTVWSEQFPACGKIKKQEFVTSSPAVTTGMVGGVATPEVFIGWGSSVAGARGCVYDFNALTGAVIWTYGTVYPVFSSPAIMATNNGNIVVVGDEADYVHAFSVDYNGTLGGSGVPIWLYDTRTDLPPPGYAQYCQTTSELCGDSVWSSPAEGMVLVNGTPHHYAYFGLGAQTYTVGRLDAIDLDTIVNNSPTLAWSFWDPHPFYDNDFGTVLVLTDTNGFAIRVYSGTNTGDMYSVDPVGGTMYFDFSTSAQLGGNLLARIHSTGALVTINGTTELIFGSGCLSTQVCGGVFGYIWAIDALSTASNGTLLWQSRNFGSEIVSSPVVANQDPNAVVFILGPWKAKAATRGDLMAIDPTTGAVLGDYPVYNHAYGALSSPAIYGNTVFVTEGYDAYSNKTTPGQGGLAAFQCVGC